MRLINKYLSIASRQKSSVILDLMQSLSLIVAAQLLIHWLLISFLRDELVLLPMLSSTGLLDAAFFFLAVCSVVSVVRHAKQEHSKQEQFKRPSPHLQFQTQGN